MRGLVLCATMAALVGAATEAKADISVCNDFRARIRVAFGYQNQAKIPASGWWSVAPNACHSVDFAFQGNQLYYSVDSDDYQDGKSTSRDHWGTKVKLYVGDTRFDFDDAQVSHADAATEAFSVFEIPPQYLGKPMSIVFHFTSGKASMTVTGNK